LRLAQFALTDLLSQVGEAGDDHDDPIGNKCLRENFIGAAAMMFWF
jgi:hypothetical protein